MNDSYEQSRRIICRITIKGPPEAIAVLRDNRCRFGTLLPMPPGLRHRQRLEWCRENWGTPHERSEYDALPDVDTSLCFGCETRETPPIAFLRSVCATFPQVWCKCVWSDDAREGVWVGYTAADAGEFKEHACDWPQAAAEFRA